MRKKGAKQEKKERKQRMRKSSVKSGSKGREIQKGLTDQGHSIFYLHTHRHTKTSLIYQLTSALFMGRWGEAQKRGREERG